MRLSGYGFVVGRSEGEGDFKDVRIRTTPEGFNYIEVARDPRNTNPRSYTIDRRISPLGAWTRVLQIDSFTPDASPNSMSETKVEVEFEDFRNIWDITPERTYGLPAGMESPWSEPLEMVGNELLLREDTQWVSGDAPINVFSNNSFSNGKYTVTVESTGIAFSLVNGRRLAFLQTVVGDFETTMSIEGVAATIVLDGGILFIEPAKPPMFIGHFGLNEQPRLLRPGLFDADDCYLICTHNIEGGRGGGAVSVVSDPYPERWIPRQMCRAFTKLIAPANVPPFVEEEPSRISVAAVYPNNDFPDIVPKVVTPYADKLGVFNAWEAEGGAVHYSPRDRPWDILLPFDGNLEELGGHAVRSVHGLRPADDRSGQPMAAFPTAEGYEVEGEWVMAEGTMFWRWYDSAEFQVLQNQHLNVYYKRGYVYFTAMASPDATGIARILPLPDWNDTKVDWTPSNLWVNDKLALTEEKSWQDVMFRPDGTYYTWGELADVPNEEWVRNPDLPRTIEQYEEIPPEWDTGLPDSEVTLPDFSYSWAPRTWGRLLFEGWDLSGYIWIHVTDMSVKLSDIEDVELWRFGRSDV